MDQQDHAVGEYRVKDDLEISLQRAIAQGIQDSGDGRAIGEHGLLLERVKRDVVGLLPAIRELGRDSPARALQRHDRFISHQNIPRASPPSTVIVVPVT
jgi:hypothetical protein